MDERARSVLNSIAFAPDALLTSVFGKGNVWFSRLSATINLLFPFKTFGLPVVSAYAEFDVVVTDHNPFLAAVALRRALSAGKSVLLICGDKSDHWPYDLLLSSALGDMLAGLSKCEDGFENDPVPVAMRLIGELVRPLANKIVVAGNFGQVHVSNRHPEGLLVLYGDPPGPSDPVNVNSDRRGLLSALRNAVKASPRLKEPRWGRVALFTKEFVITGRADNVAAFRQESGRLFWDHPLIQPMGSAAFANKDDPEAGKNLVAELFQIFAR